MQTAVLVNAGGFNSLKGIVTIGVHDKGISLSVMPIFALFHEPLFIPYDDIQGRETKWYLNAKSVELSFRRRPEVKLVMSADQIDWISRASAEKLTLRQPSVARQSPTRRWYTFSMVHAGVSLVMFGWIFWLVVSGQLPLLNG